jgi:hypothetical protein
VWFVLSVGNIASCFEGGMLFIAVVSSGPAVGSVVQSQVLVTEKSDCKILQFSGE